ncbi:MAG TPA: hypothetical protein VFX97_16850 [Pyrinomonadaceae bacterium]|nr:hypothetical protein [Pyrinomonadaceae bacterium]
MADTCTIKLVSNSLDEFGGSTDTESTVASDVPCDYIAIRPEQLEIAGKSVVGRTHTITLPSNANTEAILPKHKIVVNARGSTPALTFNDPVVLPSSLEPFLTVAATLGVQ